MPGMLLGAHGMLRKSLVFYALAFIVVAVVARAAIVAIGLPDWVFPGALVVMALGLPVILFTGYVHRVVRRTATATPTLTPGGTVAASVPSGPLASLVMKASPHVSWRRTWLGGALAVGAFVLVIGAFMLMRALGIGPAGSLLAAGLGYSWAGGSEGRNQIYVVAFVVLGFAGLALSFVPARRR